MNTLILAFQLMTRIPIPKAVDVTTQRLCRGVLFWPLIGLVTGAIDALVFAGASWLFSFPVGVMAALFCQLCVTGGFHLDGLCDTADAIYSSRSRQRMLEIMKDSRIGTNGVIAAIFDIGLKFLCVCQAKNPVLVLVLAPVAGKCVQGILMYKAIYPRTSGLGMSYIGKISQWIMVGCALGGLGIMAVAGIISGLLWVVPLAVFVMAAAILYRKYIERKIGGMTGDTLGAGSELMEIVFMLGILAVQRRIL